jgi:hypothetical protein
VRDRTDDDAGSRPDYVPRAWTQGSIDTRFQQSPARVFWWLIGMAVIPTAIGVTLLASGSVWSADGLGAVCLFVGVISIWQALVYCPKALRAMQ